MKKWSFKELKNITDEEIMGAVFSHDPLLFDAILINIDFVIKDFLLNYISDTGRFEDQKEKEVRKEISERLQKEFYDMAMLWLKNDDFEDEHFYAEGV